jgi:hypothetical protein
VREEACQAQEGQEEGQGEAMNRKLPLICCALACLLLPAAANAAPPTILSTHVSNASTESATLNAQINPQGKATQYSFEYGPADCSSNPCTSLPLPKGSLPAGTSPVAVKVEITGLAPGSSLRYRVLAESKGIEGGKAQTEDLPFGTYPYLTPSFGPCPNEAFRSGTGAAGKGAHLPDCRAYEQASPIVKNGADLWTTPPFSAAASDGSGVLFQNDFGVPNGVGAQQMPTYLAKRTANAWTHRGILPPPSLGNVASVKGWTPDLSSTFSLAAHVQATSLSSSLVDSFSTDGSLETVAPHTAKAAYDYAGASADGAYVLFESKAALTPNAIEGKPNLYIWERATDSLHLAGAENGGSEGVSPPKGALAGPYDWAAGTNLQSVEKGGAALDYYVQEAKAISASGDAVFFTAAGSGQLFVRRNPTEPQSPLSAGKCTDPSLACTTRISATEKTKGEGPDGSDAAGTRPAAFQAASEDGSIAYFTSSEKLTDDANTGKEPEPPAIARSDLDGNPASIDADFIPTAALGIAVDDTYVYWANPAGAIGRAELDGSNPEPAFIAVPPQETEPGVFVTMEPQYVAVDDEHIYWTNMAEGEEPGVFNESGGPGSPQRTDGTIARADLDGDPGSVNVDFIAGASAPQGIAVNDTHVFWANPKYAAPTIARAEIDDGENIELQFIDLAQPRPQGLAVNATHIYSTFGEENIIRHDLNGDPNGVGGIFTGAGSENGGIALDAGHVYWVRQDTGAISRSDLNFEAIKDEFIKAEGSLIGLAADASHLYWSANGDSPPNPGNDLYLYDANAPEGERLTDLSVDLSTEKGADVRGVLGISADGSHAYFAANGVLAPGATPGDCKGPNENASGTCNVYHAHGGSVEFVARLDAANRNWRARSKNGNEYQPRESRVTPDGQTLLYSSGGDLYRHALGEGTTCVTCDPSGEAGGGDAKPSIAQPGFLIPAAPAAVMSRVMSADGKRIFFETTAALALADTNAQNGCPMVGSGESKQPSCLDVYEWEAEGKGSCESAGGCTYLLSPGSEEDPSFLGGLSESGEDVFIFTRAQLVGQDKDELRDVYDLKVGGGLASQYPQPKPSCEAEGCKGPVGPAPAIPTPQTPGFQGPADPKPKRCAKGKVKKKGKCVKKPGAQKHRKHKKRHGARKTGRSHR